MKHAATVRERGAEVHPIDSHPDRKSRSSDAVELPSMAALRIVDVRQADDGTGRVAILAHGERRIEARVDDAVDGAVLKGAVSRGERVIVEHALASWTVIGALRTRATPGIDFGDEYVIEARRVTIAGDDAVVLKSGSASIALRAYGFVETLASDITARASRAHKLVGRVLRLN